ncbi:MAG: hypothetical protein PHV17_02310 [Candidatus Omnitrophica bacterium]|nr:hypothetical protein [Candidatus Omnitrophota bacterium]
MIVKKMFFFLCFLFCLVYVYAQEIKMTFDQTFSLVAPEGAQIIVDDYLAYRFAEVSVLPKEGNSFSMKLYFHPDRPDLAQYDTPEIMRKRVIESSEKYLNITEEKEVVLEEIDFKNSYGFYTILTNAQLQSGDENSFGEFKYMVRGVMRLTVDVSCGFSIMTNDLESEEYKQLFSYVLSLVKGINVN